MYIGILSFRDKKYYPNKRLIEEGTKLLHKVVLINPKRCFSQVKNIQHNVFLSTERLDVLLPRVGARIDEYTLTLVRQFELNGVKVLNDFESIIWARNNFLTLQTLAKSGVNVPNTFYVNNVKNFRQAVKLLGGYPIVLKTINSRQGKGVVLVDSNITAEFVVSSFEGKGTGLLAQEYIDPTHRKDVRVFVVGGRCIAALESKPKRNEFRANYYLDAKVKGIEPGSHIKRAAQKAAKAMGLEICGVDILLTENREPLVIEVNYSPGFHGLEKTTGINVAREIISYLEKTFGG